MYSLQRIVKSWPIKQLFVSLEQSGRGLSAQAEIKNAPERTALYDFHVKFGGKMVNFGGYTLPVQYADQSITSSHLHTRQSASIFDVSHMLQTYVYGKDAAAAIELLCTADIKGLPVGSGTLTVFTNAYGGILDDLIVNKVNEKTLYIVSNAAMRQQDMTLMQSAVSKFKAAGKDVAIEFLPLSKQSLIALQGPKAAAALTKLLSKQQSLTEFYFMQTMLQTVADVKDCRITRCGYTGEDGFEISVDSQHVQTITEALLNIDSSVKLAGLGARDSLRLEAGLCLYGADIDAKTTPIEAGLAWLVSKRRRENLDFPGAAVICNQLKNGVSRRRVGLHLLTPNAPPARTGTQIYHDTELLGEITSGCPSPSLNKNIAVGYVREAFKKPGTALQLKIRNKFYDAEVTKMPFVKSNYYNKPKN